VLPRRAFLVIGVIFLVPSKPAYVQPWRAFSCAALRRHVLVCEISGPVCSIDNADTGSPTDLDDRDQARIDLAICRCAAHTIFTAKVCDCHESLWAARTVVSAGVRNRVVCRFHCHLVTPLWRGTLANALGRLGNSHTECTLCKRFSS
jgi:hypothetical protein